MQFLRKACVRFAFLLVQLNQVSASVVRSGMSEQPVADEKNGLQKLRLKHPSVSKWWMQQLLQQWQFALLTAPCGSADSALQGSSAEVYLHGAHLTSFKPAGGKVPVLITAWKHSIMQ